jgi:phosphotransacetylase/acyl dehydratase
MNAMQFLENRTFDELRVGDSAELTRRLSREDIELFALMSGDVSPANVDEDFAKSGVSHRIVAQGMWAGALISAVLGTQLPGPGAVYLRQSLAFRAPVGIGDTITARVTVRQKQSENRRVLLDCDCRNEAGTIVVEGEAEMIASAQKIRRPRILLPEVHLHERGRRYRELLESARGLPPIATAVAHPCDDISILGALEAREAGLIAPILVGPRLKIEKAALEAKVSLEGVELIDAPHSHAAAEKSVALVREGRALALMKGSLHTDEVMAAAIDAQTGLRTERRMSHVFVFDVPHYPKPLFITDAAVNVYPTLADKRDIVQNAIDLCHALGIAQPKVAILSALETVDAKIKSTLDAAALCKMADRGQIVGGALDGPLAFDNAVSRQAAAIKHIASPVAGDADVLVAPDLEAANMIAKQLVYLAGADAAGIVLGARVPIILTSRADGPIARMASCALAQLFVHRGASRKN